LVQEWHRKFDVLVGESPHAIEDSIVELRVSLIQEELNEFAKAGFGRDIVGVADALADLLYVVYGAAVSYGIDMEEVFQEVHRSNMTKTGGGKASNGKVLKGPNWDPPNLLPIIKRQNALQSMESSRPIPASP
jgi:predicted HAD superfamily Cof-like phosphohydrolase